MTHEEIRDVINTYVWGLANEQSVAAEGILLDAGIDVQYIESAIDFTIEELAKFFEDRKECEDAG